jgi:probable H4MPT-linked C1 transfer pathway protein
MQLPCPLWQGTDHLRAALKEAQQQMDLNDNWQHVITMTGELADCFADRSSGVCEILRVVQENLRPATEPSCFTQNASFLPLSEAANQASSIASANWLATAHFAASRVGEALLLDIGSTTSDFLLISKGQVQAHGYSDAERLRSGELLYTGVVRTPVMAVASQVPFAGHWQALAAEHFATMADIYRLTGQLPEHADLLPSADGAEKSPSASARRLARMLGRDAESASMAQWRRCAEFIRGVQVNTLQMGAERLLSSDTNAERTTIIGAGVGRFLAQEIAVRLGCDYQGMDTLFVGDDALKNRAADCAPAAALACLASERLR